MFGLTGRGRRAAIAVGLALFGLAFAVRMFYRADNAASFESSMPAQSFISHRRAVRMLEGGGVLVWDDADPTKLKQIRRPPGYALFLAGVYAASGADMRNAQVAQALLDALAVVLVAAIGAALVSPGAGIAAGILYALSPHLAYYATVVTPDAPASWPLLAGVGLAIFGSKARGRAAFFACAAAGLLLGTACWLTAQSLLLPAVVGLALVAVAPRGERRRAGALALCVVAGGALAVAPITARNVAVYGSFTPIRPGLGTTLVEGLGVYDPAFPATDQALMADEAERYGVEEYGEALYQPDGSLRERLRVERARAAILARPLWFVGVMLDRIGLMLSYDTQGSERWPLDTAVVARVDKTAGSGAVRTLRAVVWLAQSALFRTWLIRLLILAGAATLVAVGRWRTGLLLAVVPAHHILLQSLLLTEYKYTLPVHAWLFLVAGAALGEGIPVLARRARAAVTRRVGAA